MTDTKRLGLAAAGVVALIVAFVLLRPSGDDKPTRSTTSTSTAGGNGQAGDGSAAAFKTVRVVHGQPQGGIKTLSYDKGDTVRLRVRSDSADEIHIHGYDLKKDVTAGGTVQFTFPASIEGRFEIELEDAGVQIADLEVNPG